MAITNGYATLTDLQISLDRTGQAAFTAREDARGELAIEAASRWIDEYTGTWFYSAAQTRYYTAAWHDLLQLPDDLISITTLKTDDDDDGVYETTWTTDDYVLEPRNAAADGYPYRQIRTNSNGDYSFPVRVRNGVELVGAFGYASSPPQNVRYACLLLAQRLYRRPDAIFGVAGGGPLGNVQIVQAQIQADADVMALLDSINRRAL